MEVALLDLLLPIVIATVCVFFTSSIIWMILPYHKKDINFICDEERLTTRVSEMDLKPGLYMFPNCETMDEMRSDEFKQRSDQGPWGIITITGTKPSLLKNLIKTYIAFLVITIFVAYIAGVALPKGAEYMHVFQVIGATAVLGHCMGGMANDFFLGKPTRFMITNFIDGVIYALLTAGIIASMWPGLGGAPGSPLIIQP